MAPIKSRPIKIPSVPSSAYNENRPANALLIAQVCELEKAVRAAGRQVQRRKVTTEAEVAAYIRHLNRALYHQVLLPQLNRRPLRAPKRRPAVRPVAKRARRRGRKR